MNHDLRLLSAALVAWATVAGGLALHPSPGQWWAMTLLAALMGGGLIAMTWFWRKPQEIVQKQEPTPSRARTSVQSRSDRPWMMWLAWVCACIAVVCAGSGWHAQSAAGPLAGWGQAHASAHLIVDVDGTPITLPAKPPTNKVRYLVPVTVRYADVRGQHVTLATPIVIVGEEGWSTVAWHSRLEVTGRLAPSNRLGAAQAVMTVRGPPRVVRTPGVVLRAVDWVRHRGSLATSRLPSDPRGLVPALVYGDTSRLPSSLNTEMQSVGMSHLNAVSGSNVTIILLTVLALGTRVGLKLRVRLILALAMLGLYVLLCRPEPSVIRAAVMGGVGVLGTSMGRRGAATPALGAAIMLLLLWDPWLAVNAGFALSSLATLGLVLLARPMSAWFAHGHTGWREKAAEMCVIPIAAQALCLPILCVMNGGVSLISLPANILAEPLVSPATLAGMAMLFASCLFVPLGQLMAWAAGIPAWGIALIARSASHIPHGCLPWPGGPSGAAIMTLILGIALLWSGAWAKNPRLLYAVGVVSLAFFGAWCWPLPGAGVPSSWIYAQCAVGQGDGELLNVGNGHAIVVDVGPIQTHGMRTCLRHYNIHVVDAIFLTHYHADHVGDLDDVFAVAHVEQVFITAVTEDSSAAPGEGEKGDGALVANVMAKHQMSAQPLSAGQSLILVPYTIQVLAPRRVIHAGSIQNNGSLILDVASMNFHALLLGDAEREEQMSAASAIEVLASQRPYDLIKVAHHGSANQNPDLYNKVRAPIAVIGVGLHNDYGHPNAKTLSMLAQDGALVFRKDTEGDATIFRDSSGKLRGESG